ncbi:MAG: class I SAM-dependent methyltransferase [Deferribacteres bacterium]|nr:class I SAM-dependent methyltransferase [Deferribacteres bacterium]
MKLDTDIFTDPLFILRKLHRNSIRENSRFLKGRVLDVGCGLKPFRKFVCYHDYTGLDKDIRVRPDVNASALNMPFPDNLFDSVICSEVLEHLKEPAVALEEIRRVLRPGGIAYITCPMCWCLHHEPDDYWRFTMYSLGQLIETNGFDVLKIERIGGVFSLVGVRLADVWYAAVANLLSFVPRAHAERMAAVLTFPVSALFYALGAVFDGLDKRDAIGWVALARKRAPGK